MSVSCRIAPLFSLRWSSLSARNISCTNFATLPLTVPNRACSNVKKTLNCIFRFPVGNVLCLMQTRNYSKGKDKKKDGKHKVPIAHVSETEMQELVNVEKMNQDFALAISHLKEEYSKHLSLRTSFGMIETIPVKFQGEQFPLHELAQVGRKSPQILSINAAAFPDSVKNIMAALHASGMNLNPQQEGTTIYVPLPKVTKEHRESLSKNAKMLFNKCNDKIRDIQNDYLRKMKSKEEKVSIDLYRNVQLKVQEIAHGYSSEAEKIMTDKQEELLSPTNASIS